MIPALIFIYSWWFMILIGRSARKKATMHNYGQNWLIFNEVCPDTPPLWHLPFASGSFWKLMKQTGFPRVQTASVQRSSSRRAFWVTLMLFDTGSHEGANTRTHTHWTKTCIPVFLSWMYSEGWMFSTQQCFILSECISSRRRIPRLSYRCWQRLQPEDGAERLFYLFLYAHTCRVQWNSLRLRGGTLRISGLTLKMNVCHIKTLHGQGGILRVFMASTRDGLLQSR